MARPLARRIYQLREIANPLVLLGRRRQIVASVVLVSALLFTWAVGQAWVVARQAPVSTVGAIDPAMNPGRVQSQQARAATAALGLPSSAVWQESEVSISGSGFGPMETIVVRVPIDGKEAQEIGRAATDWRGSFGIDSIKLPEWLVSGAHPVEAVGERSGTRGLGTLYVRAKDHWVNLGSFGVRQADRLGFVAGGFEPGSRVNVYLAEGHDLQPADDAEALVTVETDPAGNTAWSELQVPIVKPGTYSLMFRAEEGGQALSRNVVVSALVPNVELSPWSGPPGSHVELNASGFVPDEDVGIYIGDSEQAATTIAADQYGNFWGAGPVEVPYEARGQLRITLIGSFSHALVTRSFGVVAPKPWVELSTYSGFVGTSIFFSGGGFAARERITIHIERAGEPVMSVGEANEQGYYRFIGPVNVPPDAMEQVTFVLVGEQSRTQGTATFEVLTPWFLQQPS